MSVHQHVEFHVFALIYPTLKFLMASFVTFCCMMFSNDLSSMTVAIFRIFLFPHIFLCSLIFSFFKIFFF